MTKINKSQFESMVTDMKNNSLPQIKITPLNSDNFIDWKFMFTNHLICHNFYQFLENDFEDEVKALSTFKRLDRLVLCQISLNVGPEIRRELYHIESAKEAWQIITNRFEGSNHLKCIRVFRKLVDLITSKSNDLSVILTEFNSFQNQIASIFPKHDSSIWIGLLFAILPERHSHLIALIRSKEDMSLKDAIDFISSENQLSKERSKSNHAGNNAKFTSANYNHFITNKDNRNAKLFCKYCKGNDHNIKNCTKLKEKEKHKKKSTPTESSHSTQTGNSPKVNSLISSSDFENRSSNAQSGHHQNHSSNSNSDQQSQIQSTSALNQVSFSQFAITASSSLFTVNVKVDSNKWYFDTGAENHTSNNLTGCVQLIKTDHIYVNSAHGTNVRALGIGKFDLVSTSNEHMRLNDVIIDTTLEASYISGGLLDKLGYYFVGGGGSVKIYNNQNKLLCTGTQVSTTLYEMDFQIHVSVNAIKHFRTSLTDWHIRFGHLNLADLRRLLKSYAIDFIDVPDFKCEQCLLAKCSMKSFGTSHTRATSILEIIHTDLSGIIRVKNMMRMHYFLVFVDDYSRLKFVYLIKSKSEVFDTFIKFRNWIELKTGRKIKCLRSDNGTEYVNKYFQELAHQTGIEYQYSLPNRQQQNGVSERSMRTLAEMARAMLIQAKLNASYWPFAILTACYLRNRSPSSSIGFEIPFTKFFGKPAEIHHIITFGSPVVVKLDTHENKFSPRGIRGIFLGYEGQHKGYTVYVPELNKIVASRDVNVLPTADDDLLNCVNHEIEYCEEDVDNCDSTDQFDNSVQVYSDGTVNHIIRDIIAADLVSDRNNASSNAPISELNCPNSQHQSSSENSINHPSSSNNSTDHPFSSDSNHQDSSSPVIGEVIFNRTQRANYERANPHAKLQFVRPHKTKQSGKHCVYRVLSVCSPSNIDQAMNTPEAEQWAHAAIDEMNSLEANGTWTLVPRPKHKVKIVRGMWVFSVKYAPDLSIDRMKARWVLKGCMLENDNLDTYAPVLRSSSFNILLSLAVNLNLQIYQLDVKTAFLNGVLKEEIYTVQPDGFIDEHHPDWVYKLNKAVYGLPQSAKVWFEFIRDLLIKYGLKQLFSDECIFVSDDLKLIIGLYVDDFSVLARSLALFEDFKKFLKKHVTITDKGLMKYCLGINVRQMNSKILINQSTAINQLLNDLDMTNCNGVPTPMCENLDLESESAEFGDRTLYRRIVGSLLYIALKSRPDICYAITRLCRFVSCPMTKHFEASKHIIRYLKSTVNYSLKFVKSEANIKSYSDANWARDLINGKSISGNLVYLYGNLVFWQSKKQNYVALSTCESELLSVRESTSFVMYLRNMMHELDLTECLSKPSIIQNDNESTVTTVNEGGQFLRNKHYVIRANFIKDYINKNQISVSYLSGKSMPADGLTKPLGPNLFKKFLEFLNFENIDLNLIS